MSEGIWILAPDPNGQCCACNGRINPCDSCGCDIECRVYSGVASLCGYPEFIDPSSPPIKYLSITYGGGDESQIQVHGVEECGTAGDPPFCSYIKTTYEGTCILGSGTANCDPQSFGIATQYVNPISTNCTLSPDDTEDLCGPLHSGASSVSNLTPTFAQLTYSESGPLFCSVGAEDGSYFIHEDTTQTLAIPDNDANAIYRQALSASWSAWSTTTGSTCLAFSYPRTTGYDFVSQVAQWQSVTSGYTPLSSHEASLDIYRRVLGSTADYSLYQTITVDGDSSIEGVLSLSGYVPNDPGFESYACGLSIS